MSRLEEIVKEYSTCANGKRPGDVFLRVSPAVWEAVKAGSAPVAAQPIADRPPIGALFSIRVLVEEERHGWQLCDSRTGDVVEEGTSHEVPHRTSP
jgi:hypothetical protein